VLRRRNAGRGDARKQKTDVITNRKGLLRVILGLGLSLSDCQGKLTGRDALGPPRSDRPIGQSLESRALGLDTPERRSPPSPCRHVKTLVIRISHESQGPRERDALP
jgi:hypothetical protein